MRGLKLGPLAALAAVGLASCQGAHSGMAGGGNGLCAPFAATQATATQPAGQAAIAPPIAGDPSSGMDDCLHRWGYALAASSDDATHVAQATLAACSGALSRWNQQAASTGLDDAGPIQAPSLVTGEPTTPIGQHLAFAQGRALFYVVQARAGRCAAPPMQNGVPVGLARD